MTLWIAEIHNFSALSPKFLPKYDDEAGLKREQLTSGKMAVKMLQDVAFEQPYYMKKHCQRHNEPEG